MHIAKKTEKEGKKVHKNENAKGRRTVIFIGIIATVLAAVAAVLWCKKSLGGEEALAIFTIIGGSAAAIREAKLNNKGHNVVILICVFFISFGILLFISKLMISNAADSIDNEERSTVDEYQEEETGEEEEQYVAKQFVYALDVLFEDLMYYVDGHAIEKNYISSTLEELIYKSLNCGKLPERYEDDENKLNSGVYAKKTHIANEYYDSYMSVKDKNIERKYKLAFCKNARDNRKGANDEYVTIENSINLVWACVAERYELGLCIAEEENAEQINEWENEAKECNREIMKTVWNIMLIEYCLGREINKDMARELVEAYEWERDHKPVDGIDYNEIINAFKNVLNI